MLTRIERGKYEQQSCTKYGLKPQTRQKSAFFLLIHHTVMTHYISCVEFEDINIR